jgi:hypothetical protein
MDYSPGAARQTAAPPDETTFHAQWHLLNLKTSVMKKNLSLSLVGAFLIISILHLLVYASVQQVHRQAANDAPRVLADHLSAVVGSGRPPRDAFGPETAAIAGAHGIYGFVCDSNGKIMATNLAGAPVSIPKGLTVQARTRGSHYVTWAPNRVRYAMVLRAVPGTSYFAGGSAPLLYTEYNMLKLWQLVLLSWIASSLVLAFSGAILFRRFSETAFVQTQNLAA